MRIQLIALTMIALMTPAVAWDGTDTETGDSVTIEQDNLVRQGSDIEIYDGTTGDYHSATVESIERSGSTVELEVYDHETGESRTLEMED